MEKPLIVAFATRLYGSSPLQRLVQLLLFLSITTANSDGQTSVIARSDRNLSEKWLSPAVVGEGFGKQFSYALEGSVYAQPLFVPNVRMPDGTSRNVLYVATTDDIVYALDIDNPPRMLWRTPRRLTNQNEIPLPNRRNGIGVSTIRGNIGILSTPVVDTKRNAIYVVASSLICDASVVSTAHCESNDDRVVWRLHALDLRSGEEKLGGPTDIAGTFDSGKEHFVFDPRFQMNRPSLQMAASHVIVAWGSLDDQYQYRGWVMSYDGSDLKRTPDVFCTTCSPNTTAATSFFGGGIWQSGRPPLVINSEVFFFTGNGYTNGKDNTGDFHDACPADNHGNPDAKPDRPRPEYGYYANSLIRLDAANHLALTGSWMPRGGTSLGVNDPDDWCKLDYFDYDLGGSGPVLRDDSFANTSPSTNIVIGGGKDGNLRVFTANPGQREIVEKDVVCIWPLCLPNNGEAPQDRHIMAGPVYWKGRNLVFLSRENSFIAAYESPSPDNPTHVVNDKIENQSSREIPGHPGAILFLTANGADASSGILWYTYAPHNTVEFETGAAHCTLRGTLVAVKATDLSKEIWSSDKDSRDDIGYFAKFNPPLVMDGRVYVAAFPKDTLPEDTCASENPPKLPANPGYGYIHVFGNPRASNPPIYTISDGPGPVPRP